MHPRSRSRLRGWFCGGVFLRVTAAHTPDGEMATQSEEDHRNALMNSRLGDTERVPDLLERPAFEEVEVDDAAITVVEPTDGVSDQLALFALENDSEAIILGGRDEAMTQ